MQAAGDRRDRRASRSRCASARSSTSTTRRWCAPSSRRLRQGAHAGGGNDARRARGDGPVATMARCTADAPSAWVVRFDGRLGAGRPVLDLACGSGRHARLFAGAAAGSPRSIAIRHSAQALASERPSNLFRPIWRWMRGHLGVRTFDAIVVTNYLHRPLFPRAERALAPGGLLIYETFAAGNAEFGRPSNPDFLLRPRELLGCFWHGHARARVRGRFHSAAEARDGAADRCAQGRRRRRRVCGEMPSVTAVSRSLTGRIPATFTTEKRSHTP